MSKDKTNPQHYRTHPSGVECIDITRHMGFNLGNAVKYLWRAGLKDNEPTVEDLRKALWYINDEIKKQEGAAPLQAEIVFAALEGCGTHRDFCPPAPGPLNEHHERFSAAPVKASAVLHDSPRPSAAGQQLDLPPESSQR